MLVFWAFACLPYGVISLKFCNKEGCFEKTKPTPRGSRKYNGNGLHAFTVQQTQLGMCFSECTRKPIEVDDMSSHFVASLHPVGFVSM